MQSIDVFDASVGSVYLPRPRISFSAFWLKKKGNKIEMKQPPTNKTGKKNLVKKRRECKKEDATPVVVIQNGTQRRRRLKIKFKKREKKNTFPNDDNVPVPFTVVLAVFYRLLLDFTASLCILSNFNSFTSFVRNVTRFNLVLFIYT